MTLNTDLNLLSLNFFSTAAAVTVRTAISRLRKFNAGGVDA